MFMKAHHDQNQVLFDIQVFSMPGNMAYDIERSIRRARLNKALGRNGVHNEMVKADTPTLAELLTEIWTLIGRTRTYPEQWQKRLLTTIYKKGEGHLPQNYIPVCMLSCVRKIIEEAIAERMSKEMKILGCQFEFQKGM